MNLKLKYKYFDNYGDLVDGKVVGREKVIDIELTPELLKDWRAQLAPQLKGIKSNMTIAEMMDMVDALGLSPKNVIDFISKWKK